MLVLWKSSSSPPGEDWGQGILPVTPDILAFTQRVRLHAPNFKHFLLHLRHAILVGPVQVSSLPRSIFLA